VVILREILQKGELQVGEKERELALQKMRKEVASMLAAMSVNPTTLRPYAVTLIEKVMKDVHFKPDPKKPAKKQAKELLELLAKVFFSVCLFVSYLKCFCNDLFNDILCQDGQLPIQRAKMRLKISVDAAQEEALHRGLEWFEEGRTETEGGRIELVVLIKPGLYRMVEEATKRENATVLVVSLAVAGKDDKVDTKVIEKPVIECAAEVEVATAVAVVEKNKRAQKEELRLAGLMGVLNDGDDDDWKNEKKKKGKGGKGKKKK
jgi:ribosome maturation protein SDO1